MAKVVKEETLQNLGEEEVVRRLVAGLPQSAQVLVGPGDDCAVIDGGGDELLLLKTDAVVAGVHFLAETDAERVGWKAAARVVSDFGAMGGKAGELMVTLAAAGETSMNWVEGLYRGLARCAERFGASIVGGETVGLPAGSATVVSISGTGRVARESYVTRAGGSAGNGLWVTGRLGGSFESETAPGLCAAGARGAVAGKGGACDDGFVGWLAEGFAASGAGQWLWLCVGGGEFALSRGVLSGAGFGGWGGYGASFCG